MRLSISCYGTIARSQRGTLLLVVLLMLLSVTVLGMATLDGAGLELRMARNMHTSQQAFAVAEQALSRVGRQLAQPGYFPEQSFMEDCTSSCFSNACRQGLCFYGSDAVSRENCRLHAPAQAPYANASLWRTGGRHRTLVVAGGEFSVRYLVEFRCYAAAVSVVTPVPEDQARLYRITVFVDGGAGRSQVMLRATVRERKGGDAALKAGWLSWQQLPVLFQIAG